MNPPEIDPAATPVPQPDEANALLPWESIDPEEGRAHLDEPASAAKQPALLEATPWAGLGEDQPAQKAAPGAPAVRRREVAGPIPASSQPALHPRSSPSHDESLAAVPVRIHSGPTDFQHIHSEPVPGSAPDDAALAPEPAYEDELEYEKEPDAGDFTDANVGANEFDEDYGDDGETEDERDLELAAAGSGWTIPLLCLGLGLIACCVVIPQADANRRMFYEGKMLQADLEQVQKQVAVNDEFLSKVRDDPGLAERLAARQMKTIRKGQKVLPLNHADNQDADMSPFALVTVAAPPAPPPYKPVGGTIAGLCYDARSRLYLLGAAMTMVATGLVLGFGEKKNV
ncbi:MAG TPA: hypothetical protein VFC78_09545 [Tepidisphaeraceae bacterium]|nr:hypothetical protein [Tepidisphaeraceae bacterium]